MIPKRTILELIARYKLEPSLKDVFVEGWVDRDFFSWLSTEFGIDGLQVYPIETVDVPKALLVSLGLTGGNRQKNIAFAEKLEEELGLGFKLACIVDADYDFASGKKISGEYIYVTEYSCLEMHFFDARILEKFFRLIVGAENPLSDTATIMKQIENSTSMLFWVRAANDILGLQLKWVSPERSIDIEGNLDIDNFLERLLNKNAAMSEKTELKKQVSMLSKKFSDLDFRNRCNGHDFLDRLKSLVGKRIKLSIRDADELFRILMGLSEARFFADQKVVAHLQNRFIH